MGVQEDEGDAVLPDQYCSPSDGALWAVVTTSQSRTPGLWVVVMDAGKDRRIGSCPLGVVISVDRSRFHQDDREIGFQGMRGLMGELCVKNQIIPLKRPHRYHIPCHLGENDSARDEKEVRR